jgi:crotonobetainyl-CoA:carnitine CoA-transferase CaiB-like acyl-CoA transferase
MKSVYSKLRVLDVSRILVGPYASMVLGDFGAEVIKVESFQGDETRFWGPPYLNKTNLSTYFLSINRNKKSICIDIRTNEGS